MPGSITVALPMRSAGSSNKQSAAVSNSPPPTLI
jgi:hypothetical protein